MVAHENVFNGSAIQKVRGVEGLLIALLAVVPNEIKNDGIIFACIGTDRSTGDSLGPLVGTELEKLGYDVVGTLKDPLHAQNLQGRTENELQGKFIIAIDAALGQMTSVGCHSVIKGSIKPGAGVNKDLPSIGDVAISSVVNVGGFMEYFVLQNTRLSVVMDLRNEIVEAVHQVMTARKEWEHGQIFNEGTKREIPSAV